MKLTICYCY